MDDKLEDALQSVQAQLNTVQSMLLQMACKGELRHNMNGQCIQHLKNSAERLASLGAAEAKRSSGDKAPWEKSDEN